MSSSFSSTIWATATVCVCLIHTATIHLAGPLLFEPPGTLYVTWAAVTDGRLPLTRHAVGFNGHPTVKTPNIDALAWTGKVLSTWYSACPVCSCSRASLLTGRQWSRMGIPGVLSPVTNSGLPLNETTLANQLKQSGYATAICGKCVGRLAVNSALI